MCVLYVFCLKTRQRATTAFSQTEKRYLLRTRSITMFLLQIHILMYSNSESGSNQMQNLYRLFVIGIGVLYILVFV